MTLGRTILWISLLAVASPFSARAQWWNPLSSTDYEECAEQAAKDGKTQGGLGILLQSCQAKFPARRSTKGKGYVFFDTRTEDYVQVDSPSLSPADRQRIEERYREYVQRRAARDAAECEQERQQLEAERRAWDAYAIRVKAAMPLVKLLSHRINCVSQAYCVEKTITATVKNESGEALQAVSFGWALFPGSPKGLSCPSSFENFTRVDSVIRPGQTVSLKFGVRDGPAEGEFSYCVNIYAAIPEGAPDGSWRSFPEVRLYTPTRERCVASK